jgi:hypothetical protein
VTASVLLSLPLLLHRFGTGAPWGSSLTGARIQELGAAAAGVGASCSSWSAARLGRPAAGGAAARSARDARLASSPWRCPAARARANGRWRPRRARALGRAQDGAGRSAGSGGLGQATASGGRRGPGARGAWHQAHAQLQQRSGGSRSGRRGPRAAALVAGAGSTGGSARGRRTCGLAMAQAASDLGSSKRRASGGA